MVSLIMEFNFPPQNLAEVFGFFAVMFIVMLAFYIWGQWLHSIGHWITHFEY
nr:hypothetical protein [Providencia rettgeri]